MNMKYNRTLDELRGHAVLYWPEEIMHASDVDVTLPLLIKTQKKFISILNLATKTPTSWHDAIKTTSSISESMFLKHLMVLSDLGGEALNKLTPLENFFEKQMLKFDWNGSEHHYKFKEIHKKCSLTNSALKADAKYLPKNLPLSDKGYDVSMLIMSGGLSTNGNLPSDIADKCSLGSYIGDIDGLENFLKQRYIEVSRQVTGASANALGQITQKFVKKRLEENLSNDFEVISNGVLPGVTHQADGNETTFDVVVKSPNQVYFGIEVSFQVTTNSTIERKAREAKAVMRSAHKENHKVCYVIDGAGNINVRKNAVSTLCDNSDCTVAMSETEIKLLADYIKETSNAQK